MHAIQTVRMRQGLQVCGMLGTWRQRHTSMLHCYTLTCTARLSGKSGMWDKTQYQVEAAGEQCTCISASEAAMGGPAMMSGGSIGLAASFRYRNRAAESIWSVCTETCMQLRGQHVLLAAAIVLNTLDESLAHGPPILRIPTGPLRLR